MEWKKGGGRTPGNRVAKTARAQSSYWMTRDGVERDCRRRDEVGTGLSRSKSEAQVQKAGKRGGVSTK